MKDKKLLAIIIIMPILIGLTSWSHNNFVMDDLKGLSDEFNDTSTIGKWQIFKDKANTRIEELKINESNTNMLKMIPKTAGWYKNYHGAFVYKEIKGNFVASTRIKVTGKTSDLPNSIWTIAGLLVRKPVDPQKIANNEEKENWIYMQTGRGDKESRVFDTKETKNGESEYFIAPCDSGWVELKIIRYNNLFVTLYKQDGKEWTIFKRYIREDMPETIQVGMAGIADCMVAFSMTENEFNAKGFDDRRNIPDLIASFDYIRFNRPNIKSKDAQITNTKDYSTVSDKMIINW
jgi:hypothetical protein